MSTSLQMFTIYERPLDYPQGFVVRRCTVTAGHVQQEEATYHKTLVAARVSVPAGLVCLARAEDDDPCIVEVWV